MGGDKVTGNVRRLKDKSDEVGENYLQEGGLLGANCWEPSIGLS